MKCISRVKKLLNTNTFNKEYELLPVVEIYGDRRVLIERHHGVCEYCDDKVVVKIKSGDLCVLGCGLQIAEMSKSQLVITGNIHGVTLKR